jgi:hypothetical protein
LGVAEEGGKIGVPSCFGIHGVHLAVPRTVQGVVEDAYEVVLFIVGTNGTLASIHPFSSSFLHTPLAWAR